MARLAYTLLTLGAPAAVYALAHLGWRLDVAVLLAVSVSGFFVGFVERAVPWERRWNLPQGDSAVDVLHLAISTIAVEVVFALAVAPLPSLEVWPASLPLPVQVVLALLVAELGAYWAHRWMHALGPLWRVHRVHHSPRRLHSLNASRNHPLETLMLLLTAGGPLLVLGAPPLVIALTAALAIAHLQFQHANARLELGGLNWLLAGPELHRWHHSRVPEDANGNYGHVLIVWDVLFRTRIAHPRRPPADVGLFDGSSLPESYAAQLAAPFR